MFLPKVKKFHVAKGNIASTTSNVVNIFKPDVVQVDYEPLELTLLGFP